MALGLGNVVLHGQNSEIGGMVMVAMTGWCRGSPISLAYTTIRTAGPHKQTKPKPSSLFLGKREEETFLARPKAHIENLI